MDRDADRARLVRNRARDGLPDPPRRVGRKFVSAPILEFFHGLHQAHVAFLDQIEERQPAVRVFFGDGNDEPQVGLDHFGLGLERLGGKFAQPVERLEKIPEGHPHKFLKRADFLLLGLDEMLLRAGFALRFRFGERAQAVLQFIVDVFRDERHFLDDFLFEAKFLERRLKFLVGLFERRQGAPAFGLDVRVRATRCICCQRRCPVSRTRADEPAQRVQMRVAAVHFFVEHDAVKPFARRVGQQFFRERDVFLAGKTEAVNDFGRLPPRRPRCAWKSRLPARASAAPPAPSA